VFREGNFDYQGWEAEKIIVKEVWRATKGTRTITAGDRRTLINKIDKVEDK